MNVKNVIILVIVVAIASAGLTKYYFPNVESVEVTKEVVRNDIRTIIKTVERPDGTKETITETTDKSTKKETTKSEVVLKEKQWMFDIGARISTSNRDIYYDLQVQRRVLGPFYMGAKASTDKTIGLSVGMEF